jgi:hypothetical protein
MAGESSTLVREEKFIVRKPQGKRSLEDLHIEGKGGRRAQTIK